MLCLDHLLCNNLIEQQIEIALVGIQRYLYLVSYAGERPWWPIQGPNKGRQKKVRGYEEREIISSLLILDLKEDKL